MGAGLPGTAVAEGFAQGIAALDPGALPPALRVKCEDLLLDVVGLCIAARHQRYVRGAREPRRRGALHRGRPSPHAERGRCRVRRRDGDHGEDYDDTFEGGPVHAGAVVVPAVLAACGTAATGAPRSSASPPKSR